MRLIGLIEYVFVVSSPHLIYLIDVIENVQRNFTTQFPGLYYLNYCDRLSFCNFEPLEVCKLRNDLIMVHKILHSHVSVNINNCISISQTNCTRSNLYKLDKFRAKFYARKFFYAYRIVDERNSLNNRVVAMSHALYYILMILLKILKM